jgi:DNA-directed RNA polymerase subunit K/omega
VRSEEGRVEELSRAVGGRFKLTTLIQKQARQYYEGGRAFMPSVRNFDDLFNYILDEIEQGKIDLILPGEMEEAGPPELPEPAEEEE